MCFILLYILNALHWICVSVEREQKLARWGNAAASSWKCSGPGATWSSGRRLCPTSRAERDDLLSPFQPKPLRYSVIITRKLHSPFNHLHYLLPVWRSAKKACMPGSSLPPARPEPPAPPVPSVSIPVERGREAVTSPRLASADVPAPFSPQSARVPSRAEERDVRSGRVQFPHPDAVRPWRAAGVAGAAGERRAIGAAAAGHAVGGGPAAVPAGGGRPGGSGRDGRAGLCPQGVRRLRAAAPLQAAPHGQVPPGAQVSAGARADPNALSPKPLTPPKRLHIFPKLPYTLQPSLPPIPHTPQPPHTPQIPPQPPHPAPRWMPRSRPGAPGGAGRNGLRSAAGDPCSGRIRVLPPLCR